MQSCKGEEGWTSSTSSEKQKVRIKGSVTEMKFLIHLNSCQFEGLWTSLQKTLSDRGIICHKCHISDLIVGLAIPLEDLVPLSSVPP